MVSNLLSAVILLGFVYSISAFALLNPYGQSGTGNLNQNYEVIQNPYRQVQYVVRSNTLPQVNLYRQPQQPMHMGQVNQVQRYTNTAPAPTYPQMNVYRQNQRRTSYGKKTRGLFSGNNLGMLMALGNERGLVTSMLGTSPFMGYYPGQMVKSSPISPGGGMFVGADGTDGTIINADGSRTEVDGSDVTREYAY